MEYSQITELFEKINRRKYEVWLVSSDWHIPYHSKECYKKLKKCARLTKPNKLIINGDFLDCEAISRFPKEPGSVMFRDEIKVGKKILNELKSEFPEMNISMLEGNHEHRLIKYIRENNGFFGLDSLKMENLLNLEELGIEYVKYNDYLKLGLCNFRHGKYVSQHSAFTAKKEMDVTNLGPHLFTGHTHRIGNYSKTNFGGKWQAWETGCMCNIKKCNYIDGIIPNWQNGFLMLLVSKCDVIVVPVYV